MISFQYNHHNKLLSKKQYCLVQGQFSVVLKYIKILNDLSQSVPTTRIKLIWNTNQLYWFTGTYIYVKMNANSVGLAKRKVGERGQQQHGTLLHKGATIRARGKKSRPGLITRLIRSQFMTTSIGQSTPGGTQHGRTLCLMLTRNSS